MTDLPIQDIFNRIAPVYDQLNDWLSLGLHRIWKQMTIKWSEASPGDLCLDVCCGSGDLTWMLAQQVGVTGQVIGVDFATSQLAIARERYENRYPNFAITWMEADALSLPFPDHYFDAVTMGYGLRNLRDIPRGMKELHRVLKPGAKAAILDFHRPSHPQLISFQQWYLDNIVVPTAQRFGLTAEYAYISSSLAKFLTGPEQEQLSREIGFAKAIHYPMMNGMMGVLVVTKV